MIIHVKMHVEPDRTDGKVRYGFKLHAVPADDGQPMVERDFIIDVPLSEDGSTDVWVLSQASVEIARSTPDLCASFLPREGL